MRAHADGHSCWGAIGDGRWRHPDELNGMPTRGEPRAVARARPLETALPTEAPALKVRARAVGAVALLAVGVCCSIYERGRHWHWRWRWGWGAIVLAVPVAGAIALARHVRRRVCVSSGRWRKAHVEYSRLRLWASVHHMRRQLSKTITITSKVKDIQILSLTNLWIASANLTGGLCKHDWRRNSRASQRARESRGFGADLVGRALRRGALEGRLRRRGTASCRWSHWGSVRGRHLRS